MIKQERIEHIKMGERRGVFNWQALKSHKEIILAESIIDAIALVNNKIKNVIPCLIRCK